MGEAMMNLDQDPDGVVAHVVQPELGKAVVFFATLQPPSGILPDYKAMPHKSIWDENNYRNIGSFPGACSEDSLHAGAPAIDNKDIVTCWVWPPGVESNLIKSAGEVATD